MDTSEPIRRTSEIEEITNLYLIHPTASSLTPLFARLGISPNAISLTGMVFGILAGFAYYHYQDRRYVIAGFILMVAWHVMDGVDGQLARLTHSQSQLGKILDGICDYVTFIAVYSGLAAALSGEMGSWVWVLAIVAGLCHAVQSAMYELQRQEYNFWGWDRKSAELLAPDALPASDADGSMVPRLLDMIYRLYVRCQLHAAGIMVEFRQRLAMTLEAEPERAELIRERYRALFAPSVRQWSVMSANYRTLGIFIAALIGGPQYYFWFETVIFSLISVLLISRQRARCALFFKNLDGPKGR
ncbi:MAG: CDP-diacylglycerol--serine O-phosphatidyltransferase [Rhodospirillales bacterium]|nr:CDP-diacylglycerol--serine O-phosphatidyltransferase [Rhodospirillales bacterium]